MQMGATKEEADITGLVNRTCVMSCKHGTQDVCTVNEVRKYHSMCKMVDSVHAAVETQRRIFC